jgi:pimeloyl-ACP methyl ester carboxylesterase
MPYVSVRGVRLYFEEHGSGPCVIAAHGMLGSIATATAMSAPKLASNGLRVIAYDARGHGLSDYTDRHEDYSWTALAEDMHQLMNALGIERATICGTSMGAGVALTLALAQPTRVERLILRSPPPFAEDLGPARRRMSALASMCHYLGVPLTALIARMLPGNAEQARMISRQRRAALLPAIRGLLFHGAPLPTERLGEIHVPTRIFCHLGDAMHPLRSGELIRDRIPGASLHVAASAQHWKQNPDEFCALVASFIMAECPRSDDGFAGPANAEASVRP